MRDISALNDEIGRLEGIARVEAEEEARKKSWRAWVLSSMHKKAEESEDERALKDRARQERRIEKDMKERRVEGLKRDLVATERSLEAEKGIVDAADLEDDLRIESIWSRMRVRQEREREERDRAERENQRMEYERMARTREQQRERQERRAQEAEYVRRQLEEEMKRRDVLSGDQYRRINRWARRTRPACLHKHWWPKVEGFAEVGGIPCPECGVVRDRLLECRECDIVGCGRCRRGMRASPGGFRYSEESGHSGLRSIWDGCG